MGGYMEKLLNPIVLQRADPWVYKHTDGFYYFSASVPEYNRIEIRRAKTISELGAAVSKTIWAKHDSGIMSANIWAPEIHFINGTWYVYFAAAHTSEAQDGLYDHRIFVIENSSPDPFKGTWTEKGQVITHLDTFSLDATSFIYKDAQYLVWAQRDPAIAGNSNLYIARMKNPWTLETNPVMLTKPEYDWETIGFLVNEGPAVLVKNRKVFITYSASATDSNYCIGLLYADEGSDLLNPASWSKSKKPVMVTDEKNEIFGPGHSCFTTDGDGNDLIIFHARPYKEIIGDPLYDPNRHTMAKYLKWDAQNHPVFI